MKSYDLSKWSTSRPIIKPRRLKVGDTIGVFTPSSPGYILNEELFLQGVKNLERLGFNVKLGSVTARRGSEGYRSASPMERAREFMDLICDDSVHALMSTIGGSNSSSLIGYLDFDLIREKRKVICGYSDVTSLHLAIQKFSGLSTVYGPAVMCWFGDWPNGCEVSTKWFMDAVSNHQKGERSVLPPSNWSNHRRSWSNGEWKTTPRLWQSNSGWKVLSSGAVTAPIAAFNFNTLLSAAGTPYWPDLKGRLLLIEDMDAPLTRTERGLRQLMFMGVFDQIAGLLVGKPEFYDQQGAPFGYDDLFMEVIGPRPYPIVSQFDCGHTLPMLSIPQLVNVTLEANEKIAQFKFLESGIE